MTYDETLHALASWAGRYVIVAIRPSDHDWNVANLAGVLPQRTPEAIEGADELDGESYTYRFSNMGWVTAFFLRRDQFVSATLDDRHLVIELAGTTLDIFAPPKVQR